MKDYISTEKRFSKLSMSHKSFVVSIKCKYSFEIMLCYVVYLIIMFVYTHTITFINIKHINQKHFHLNNFQNVYNNLTIPCWKLLDYHVNVIYIRLKWCSWKLFKHSLRGEEKKFHCSVM